MWKIEYQQDDQIQKSESCTHHSQRFKGDHIFVIQDEWNEFQKDMQVYINTIAIDRKMKNKPQNEQKYTIGDGKTRHDIIQTPSFKTYQIIPTDRYDYH